MTHTDNAIRETMTGLLAVFLSVLWWTSVSALLFLHVVPSLIQLSETSWTEVGLNDPFLTYAADGASLALGTGVYMTNHPGTPLHEFYAGMTTLFQWALAISSDNPAAFGNDQMRLWIQTHVQTFVVIARLAAPLGYFLLLLTIAVGSARLFGSRWFALPAMLTMGNLCQNYSVRTSMESFYPAALVAAAVFGFSGQASRRSIHALAVVAFWFALVLSLKLVNFPYILLFLYLLCLQRPKLESPSGAVHRLFEIFTAWILPIFLAVFATAIWATKSAKISPRGVRIIITLISLCVSWLGSYTAFPRLREWFRRQQHLCAAITLIVIQFFIINIPMAWEAWVGFLLNANEKFRWNIFLEYGRMFASNPLIVWAFGVGLVLWGLQGFRTRRLNWEERFPNTLCLSQAFPVYWFWISNYRMRNYNILPFEIFSTLCAFSCLGYLWQFVQKRWGPASSERFPALALGIAFSVLIPILGFRGLDVSPRSALHRFGMSLRSLDHFRPEAFDQGLNARGHYTPAATQYLWLANMYSAFHFPTQEVENLHNTTP